MLFKKSPGGKRRREMKAKRGTLTVLAVVAVVVAILLVEVMLPRFEVRQEAYLPTATAVFLGDSLTLPLRERVGVGRRIVIALDVRFGKEVIVHVDDSSQAFCFPLPSRSGVFLCWADDLRKEVLVRQRGLFYTLEEAPPFNLEVKVGEVAEEEAARVEVEYLTAAWGAISFRGSPEKVFRIPDEGSSIFYRNNPPTLFLPEEAEKLDLSQRKWRVGNTTLFLPENSGVLLYNSGK